MSTILPPRISGASISSGDIATDQPASPVVCRFESAWAFSNPMRSRYRSVFIAAFSIRRDTRRLRHQVARRVSPTIYRCSTSRRSRMRHSARPHFSRALIRPVIPMMSVDSVVSRMRGERFASTVSSVVLRAGASTSRSRRALGAWCDCTLSAASSERSMFRNGRGHLPDFVRLFRTSRLQRSSRLASSASNGRTFFSAISLGFRRRMAKSSVAASAALWARISVASRTGLVVSARTWETRSVRFRGEVISALGSEQYRECVREGRRGAVS